MPQAEIPTGKAFASPAIARTESYDFRLADILRKRRRPLFLVLNAVGELQSSSVPDWSPASEQRLVGQAVAQAGPMITSDREVDELAHGEDCGGDSQRVALLMQDGAVYSVRLFLLHPATGVPAEAVYAVVVEPIAGPFTDGVDFAVIKEHFRLSNRELDVLIALMTGTRDKQIARALDVSAGTVRAYLKSVRAKLGVTTRTGIVNLVHEVSGKSSSNREK